MVFIRAAPVANHEVVVTFKEDQTMSDNSLTGLTEDEAKEFHAIFVKSFIAFTAIAAVAHLFAWIWRPWAQ